MWKTGVVAKAQFRAGEKRPIAFTLLGDLEESFEPGDEPLLEAIYERVVVGGHVYKTTKAGRFSELDTKFIDEVQKRFAGTQPVRIHDLGASSGVTSLDLLGAFQGRVDVELHASDLYDHIDFVTCSGSDWTVVFDNAGRPLQFVGRRFVLSAVKGEPKRVPLNYFMERRLRRSLLPQAQDLLETARFEPGQLSFESAGGRVRRLQLVHPHVARALREQERFTFGRHDVFEPSETRYHVVRALNILNPGYFPPEQILVALRAIAAGMEIGGLLLVGRTAEEDGRTRATAFVRGESRFDPIWDHRDGAENRDLVAGAEL